MNYVVDRLEKYLAEAAISSMTNQEVDAALEENVRIGHMVRNSDGTFSMTEAGIRHVEFLLAEKGDLAEQ